MTKETDPKPQPDKFREAARELGCDEDEARFEEMVRKVVGAPRSEAVGPDESDIEGMTPNERLSHFGLLKAFDRATIKRNREEMIRIFHQAQFPSPDAERSVDSILADPTLYGLLKR